MVSTCLVSLLEIPTRMKEISEIVFCKLEKRIVIRYAECNGMHNVLQAFRGQCVSNHGQKQISGIKM